MTTKLLAASAIALVPMLMSGTAGAASASARHDQTVAAVTAPTLAKVNWHYAWRYHFNKFAELVPGWVAVLNTTR